MANKVSDKLRISVVTYILIIPIILSLMLASNFKGFVEDTSYDTCAKILEEVPRLEIEIVGNKVIPIYDPDYERKFDSFSRCFTSHDRSLTRYFTYLSFALVFAILFLLSWRIDNLKKK